MVRGVDKIKILSLVPSLRSFLRKSLAALDAPKSLNASIQIFRNAQTIQGTNEKQNVLRIQNVADAIKNIDSCYLS